MHIYRFRGLLISYKSIKISTFGLWYFILKKWVLNLHLKVEINVEYLISSVNESELIEAFTVNDLPPIVFYLAPC